MIILQKNIKGFNLKQPQILDHRYRILIVGGSGFGKSKYII